MAFQPKILVVEDDKAMLRLLGEVLGQMGAEPHLVGSSVQAAELVEKEKFDGVFLDWRMPEMDGLELARKIRASRLNPGVPMVMLTAVHSPTALKECFAAGVDFFLQKPVSVQQLRRLLNASRGLMLEERRHYQRAPVALEVRCRWDNQQATGRSVNVSATGILLELDAPPAVGTEVTLEVEFPGQAEALELGGRVTRLAAGCGPAIAFHDLPRGVRLLLTSLVEKTLAALPPSP